MKLTKAEPAHRHQFHDVQLGFIDRLLIKSERESPDFNRRMFDEDFARLFRSANHRSGSLFEIVSNDDELTQRLLGDVETRYSPHSVDETVRELVEEIAQSLIWFGTAYYFHQDSIERGEGHLASFSSSGVVRLFGKYIQWVPRRTESYWDRDDEELPREVRILDAAKIMRFEMPKSIKHMLSAQHRILAALDKHQFGATDFQTQVTHENPNPTNHFDFRVWKDAQERALYRATRGTGWNGRKYDRSKRSDFFDCHRLIRFRRNQLVLRDDILRQLSVELSRIGKGYKIEFSVEISATEKLPSVEHLNELEARLTREDVEFAEIVDYFFKG